MARLKEKYTTEIVAKMMTKFSYSSVMQVPRVQKVVINMGLGEAVQNVKVIEIAQKELAAITGQKPVITKSRKAIANFKLRENMPIGCKVTLRSEQMYEFIDRLFNLSLPRIRDFKGVSAKAFDGRGNYALGIQEQIIFPEIEYDKIDKIRGMNIVINTSARTDEEARALLGLMGMPFEKN
jgi:large subunit ribosomal protein L5